MQTAMALLVLLATAALNYLPVKVGAQTDHTYVSNQSGFSITASITYNFGGNAEFQNREIAPGKYDSDEYSEILCNSAQNNPPVNVEILVDDPNLSGTIQVDCDASVVVTNSNTFSVDVFQSVYNQITTPDGTPLMSMYFT